MLTTEVKNDKHMCIKALVSLCVVCGYTLYPFLVCEELSFLHTARPQEKTFSTHIYTALFTRLIQAAPLSRQPVHVAEG